MSGDILNNAVVQVLEHPSETVHELRIMRVVGDRTHALNFDTLEWEDMADAATLFTLEPRHRLVRGVPA